MDCDKPLKSIVGRIGGKNIIKKDIVNSFFPKDYENMTYVEPFVGGGAIFFYKRPSKKDVINDLDSKLISVYKGVKKYNPDETEKLLNNNISKEEFDSLKTSEPTSEHNKFIKNFILFKTSFLAKGTNYNYANHHPHVDLNCHYQRLKKVTILNKDYKKVIEKYDSPNTFFYLDPPYEGSTGSHYTHSSFNIEELYDILKNIKGKFLVSFNISKEALRLFKDFNIYKIKTKYNVGSTGKKFTKKVELLIKNY